MFARVPGVGSQAGGLGPDCESGPYLRTGSTPWGAISLETTNPANRDRICRRLAIVKDGRSLAASVQANAGRCFAVTAFSMISSLRKHNFCKRTLQPSDFVVGSELLSPTSRDSRFRFSDYVVEQHNAAGA